MNASFSLVAVLAILAGGVIGIILRKRIDAVFAEDLARAAGKSKQAARSRQRSDIFARIGEAGAPMSSSRELDIRTRLERANSAMSPSAWVGTVAVIAFMLAALAALAASSFGLGAAGAVVFAIAGALCGWFLCRLYLNSRAKSFRASVERTLPNAIELLAITVGAGLTLQDAMRTVAANKETVGASAEEFARVMREVDYAGLDFNAALMSMSERMESPTIASFVSSVIQGSKGAGIKDMLVQQAEDSRSAMRDSVKEQIAKIGVKMTLPMVFCFLPGILAFILIPSFAMVLEFFQ